MAAVLALAAFAGACTSSGLPSLPGPPGSLGEAKPTANGGPVEAAFMVPGTPTAVYALVARGVHGCWLAGDGPLKATHMFQAEAAPPATGGAAEIVIRERDVSLRDQRGPPGYRISFASEAAGVRVSTRAIKFEPPIAQAMAKDVEVWAKGGTGCQLRVAMPPPPPPPAASKSVTGKTKAKKR